MKIKTSLKHRHGQSVQFTVIDEENQATKVVVAFDGNGEAIIDDSVNQLVEFDESLSILELAEPSPDLSDANETELDLDQKELKAHYSSQTKADLLEIAAAMELEGFSQMKKDELIDFLILNDNVNQEEE